MALTATAAAGCAFRNAGFLANVQAELTQQFMRLGSHASLVVFGGNNEVEQSLEWYEETRDNLAMYAADYSALFEATVGTLAQKVGWGPARHLPESFGIAP
jgi:beta-galactosidase/beta-glucuronidase